MNRGGHLVGVLNKNFAVTALNNSTKVELSASFGEHVNEVVLSNSSADIVRIFAGPSGAEFQVAQIGPGAPDTIIPCKIDKGQRISAMSTFSATLSAGYLGFSLYH